MGNRRLDALFAERVLGCKVRDRSCGCYHLDHAQRNDEDFVVSAGLPSYTTSLDAAWQGVERLLAQPAKALGKTDMSR